MRSFPLLLLITAALTGGAAAVELEPTSCVTCHRDPVFFDEDSIAHVAAFQNDIHAGAGLSCHDCHGGNPDPALADDPYGAMDSEFAANPYVGSWAPVDIPAACGSCHSKAETMRRFRPNLRVDQESEFWTSQHGMALRAGREGAATCTDCHGVHGMLAVADSESPVHPSHVAETCGGCHSDPERMAGVLGPGGGAVRTDPYALWRVSVHAERLLDGLDLSAPTCNTCHGNHGATPPDVESLAFICGQCHVRESKLFLQGPKYAGLEGHNEFLEGGMSCGDCHTEPDPSADVEGVHAFLQCAACHDHHAIIRPTVAMLDPLPETPCAFCHEVPKSPAAPVIRASRYPEVLAEIENEADAMQLAGDDRWDWLVDRTGELAVHAGDGSEGRGSEPLPHFTNLYSKLRIGKTRFAYHDAQSGEERVRRVTSCADCHARSPLLGSGDGLAYAAEYLERVRGAAVLTADAERLLVTARRGGVGTREAQGFVSGAIDAQITAQALFHGFSLEPESELSEKLDSAAASAQQAVEAGIAALSELRWRRRGLFASLLVIFVVLLGLAAKIHELG